MRSSSVGLNWNAYASGSFDDEDDSQASASNSVAADGETPVCEGDSNSTGVPAQRLGNGMAVARPVKRKNGRIVVLHRDVFWLGKQWAVTGYGLQAISTKLEMKFDIDASRIWEDNLDEPLRSQAWFDPADFEEALAFARRRAKDQPAAFQLPSSDER